MQDNNKALQELLGIYRHEFLNYLQVVGGLAQLNKTERLLSYIRRASEEVQQFGRLTACGDPRLALTIYQTLYQSAGYNLLLDIRGTVPVLTQASLEAVSEILSDCCNNLKDNEDCTVKLILDANSGPFTLRLRLIGDCIPDKLWERLLKIALLRNVTGLIDKERNELSLTLDKDVVSG